MIQQPKKPSKSCLLYKALTHDVIIVHLLSVILGGLGIHCVNNHKNGWCRYRARPKTLELTAREPHCKNV